jgi:hypothetical protein
MSPDTYAADFLADLHAVEQASPRTQQSHARVLGFSDVGGCPERGRRFLSGEPFSSQTDMTAARVGNWVDAGLKQVRNAQRPHLLTDLRVSCTLPSGIQLTGHPDEVDPSVPLVIDYKSKAGLSGVRRNGSDDEHRIQRALQYLACLQSGVFTSDQGWVGNIYFDRSGKDPEPVVEIVPFQEEKHWIDRADEWLLDVLAHVESGTQAERTKYLPFCERFCPFFATCRGADLYDGEVYAGQIPTLARIYADADSTEKAAKELKAALRDDLLGLNGVTDAHRIRTSSDNKLTVTLLEVGA